MSYYLVEAHVKQKVHAVGKRLGADALSVLDAFVDEALDRAVRVHDGGAKTLTGTVMRVALRQPPR